MCGGIVVEVIECGEFVRGELDGVPGLAHEAADVAGVAAELFVPELGQGAEGLVGQAVAVVQDGGEQLAGQGDLGRRAGGGDLGGR